MKKFLKKLILFCSAFLILSWILSSVIYPRLSLTNYSWGSSNLELKRKLLITNPDKYNTCFIGSSRVWKQINPGLFDSLVNEKINARSVNLGENWFFAPETHYFLRNLLDEEKFKPKYILMELSKIKTIDFMNIHTNRMHYWCNPKDNSFAVKAIMSSNFSLPERVYNSVTYSLAYLDKVINLGYLTEGLNARANYNSINEDTLTLMGNGYSCGNILTLKDSAEAVDFLRDTSGVQKLAEFSAKQFEKFESNPALLSKYNRVYRDRIIELIKFAESKGAQLIFIMSPRVDKNQYNELIPLYHSLPEKNRMEFSDSRKYPELYIAKNSYNTTHLNCKAAEDYTRLIARRFLEIAD